MSIYPGERCQHIKMSGDRCGAPALRDQKFCRFHNCCGPVQVDVSTSAAVPPAPFLLPVLEDASSIQLAITQVCEHLLHRRLDAKKAGVLLYAMQVASSNLGRLNEDKSQDKSQKKSSEENNQENSPEKSVEASSSAPASSEAIPTGQDDSGSISSGEPDRLPPGTIQACEQQRQFAV
ncbi:MAG: hypothetical protein ABR920_12980 [Terriglobales bacterium]